jgi:hypothetical protein
MIVGGNFLDEPIPSYPKFFLFLEEKSPIRDLALLFLESQTRSTFIKQLAD